MKVKSRGTEIGDGRGIPRTRGRRRVVGAVELRSKRAQVCRMDGTCKARVSQASQRECEAARKGDCVWLRDGRTGQGKALFGCARALSSGLCGPFRVRKTIAPRMQAGWAGRVVATTGGCEGWGSAGGECGWRTVLCQVTRRTRRRGICVRETRSRCAIQPVRPPSPREVDCSDAAELSCSE